MQTEALTPATPTTLAAAVGRPAHTSSQPGRGRVVLVHGFAQTSRCWGPLAEDLAADHIVCSIDAPGHAASTVHASSDLWACAELLSNTLAALPRSDGDRTIVVGYSMGARMALHLALHDTDAVDALVLIGATAGIADDAERSARRRRDEELARRLELGGLDAFLEDWLALPMFAGLAPWARFERERRRNTPAGLAASLRHAGTGAMEPVWSRLASLDLPVLCVTGELDERFDAVAVDLVAGIGQSASHQRVPAAGHAAHLEQSGATIAALRRWLTETVGS